MSKSMKNRFLKYLITTALILMAANSSAQQDPMFTHYMYNMSVINPAYATDNADVLNLGGLYRAQWVGAVGGPTSGTFFAHKPISKRVELGISVVHDQIGDVVNDAPGPGTAIVALTVGGSFVFVASTPKDPGFGSGGAIGVTADTDDVIINTESSNDPRNPRVSCCADVSFCIVIRIILRDSR